MKIFLDRGKDHVVLKRMMPIWKKMGHALYDEPKGCDVHLSFIRFRQKSHLPKVVRIDGVYYDLDTDYKSKNRSIGEAHSLADAVIYQSETAKIMSEKYLKQRKKGSVYSIIYNGVAEDWCGKFIRHRGFNIMVSAKWRRHKRLEETIETFLACFDLVPDIKLHIFGKLCKNKPVKHSSIMYYGMRKRKKMGRVFAKGDLFMHLSKKDACPNSVVEAIGAGMPVITTKACGGSAEMCDVTKGCIVCEGDKVSYKHCYPYRDEYNELSKALKRGLVQSVLKVYADRRRVKPPNQLTISHMAEQYIKIMRRLV